MQIKKGDIIGIKRNIALGFGFEHYGIYIGNQQVIHFSSEHSDKSMKHNTIIQSSLSDFFRNQTELELFIVDYKKDKYGIYRPYMKKNILHQKRMDDNTLFKDDIFIDTCIQNANTNLKIAACVPLIFYDVITRPVKKIFVRIGECDKPTTLYTPEETIQRAKSRLGEKGYSLSHNNCEHFVNWCKIGQNTSYQIDKTNRLLENVWKRTEIQFQ